MTTTHDLIESLRSHNADYRAGQPTLTDAEYDRLHASAKAISPDHPFFAEPEPEQTAGERVRHLEPMLSTDKARTTEEVISWVNRVREAARDDFGEIMVRVTPKLDGIAAYRRGDLVYTRGQGGYGTNISRLFAGDNPIAGTGDGPGEIVVSRRYFDEVLASEYGLVHPRNAVAGLVGADTLDESHLRALSDGEIKHVRYADLRGVVLPIGKLASVWDSLFENLIPGCPFLCDGLVVDVMDESLRAELGSTSHHHRWQLALKVNDEFATTTVKAVRLTTGRTSRITPTLEIEPVTISGATITWVTAHNIHRLREWQLGPGAVIQITRSGGVIPALVKVVTPGDVSAVNLDACPSCGAPTHYDEPTLSCTNTLDCGATASRRLQHFFRTLGTCNGFGPGVCDQLIAGGILRPSQALAASLIDLLRCGISEGIAANLMDEKAATLSRPISEAYLLAAMGIPDLGRGDARRLLSEIPIEALDTVTAARIESIRGFGFKTSVSIAQHLHELQGEINAVLSLGWNLERVAAPTAFGQPTPLSGLTLVFTGAMQRGREVMEAQARSLGATIGSSVSAKTSLLVCGDKVGAAKTDKAAKLSVRAITEAEYLALIAAPA